MQYFKTVSFAESDNRSKVVTVSFAENEKGLFDIVSKMTSTEIKKLIQISDYNQLLKNAEDDYRSVSQTIKVAISKALETQPHILSSDVTFRSSKTIPFQRWYPYIEGYSPDFVKKLIDRYLTDPCIIYEPFAGTGTTLFAADSKGFSTYYSEINPLLRFVIDTKLSVLKLSNADRRSLLRRIETIREEYLSHRVEEDKTLDKNYKNVFKKSVYFPESNYKKILQIRTFLNGIEDGILKNVLTIPVLSALIPSSYLKKQGDLRFRTKKELEKGIDDFDVLLANNLQSVCVDLMEDTSVISQNHYCVAENAKKIGTCYCEQIGAVITSPPYLNGTNYIRNTKLELWFLMCLKGEKDLRTYRDEILTSGINDVKAEYAANVSLDGISELYDKTISALESNAYDSRIPLMAKCYFSEMYEMFKALRSKLLDGAYILIDIGDSIFNGVHISTDCILSQLLESLGYSLNEKELLRERRSRNGQIISQTLLVFTYGIR